MASIFTRIFGSHQSVTNSPVKGSSIMLWQICHQSCQPQRNPGPFTAQVLEDSAVPFWLYFGVVGMIHGKLQNFFQMFSQKSCTPNFGQSFRVKRCGLYAGVYGNRIHKADSLASERRENPKIQKRPRNNPPSVCDFGQQVLIWYTEGKKHVVGLP